MNKNRKCDQQTDGWTDGRRTRHSNSHIEMEIVDTNFWRAGSMGSNCANKYSFCDKRHSKIYNNNENEYGLGKKNHQIHFCFWLLPKSIIIFTWLWHTTVFEKRLCAPPCDEIVDIKYKLNGTKRVSVGSTVATMATATDVTLVQKISSVKHYNLFLSFWCCSKTKRFTVFLRIL